MTFHTFIAENLAIPSQSSRNQNSQGNTEQVRVLSVMLLSYHHPVLLQTKEPTRLSQASSLPLGSWDLASSSFQLYSILFLTSWGFIASLSDTLISELLNFNSFYCIKWEHKLSSHYSILDPEFTIKKFTLIRIRKLSNTSSISCFL